MGANEIALGLTLSIAAFTDWRQQKIYNILLVPSLFLAILLHTFQEGEEGLKFSLFGAIIGFLLLLIPYLMGGIGAGDVKLLTVIGAYGGVSFVLTSFLYGAIVGGLISALLLIRRKALGTTLKHFLLFYPILRKPCNYSGSISKEQQEKFPYGIAVVLGTIIAFYLPLGGGWL